MHDALVKIQSELKAPKGQFNSFGKYNYRSCEDILEAVKPLLAEAGLTLIITDSIEAVGDRVYIKAEVAISDGEKHVSNCAFAREPLHKKGMDEAQVTGATSSYARKYALAGLFLLDDNKDADTQKPADNDNYQSLCEEHADSIQAIKDGITSNDLSTASEAWFELGDEVKKGLWRAPTKGGCFTTKEREVMKSQEFRLANGVAA